MFHQLHTSSSRNSHSQLCVDLSQPLQSEPSVSLQNPTLLNWYKYPYVILPRHLPSGLNRSSCHYLPITHYAPHPFAACLPICLIGHSTVTQHPLLTPSFHHSSACLPNQSSSCYLLITHYSHHHSSVCLLSDTQALVILFAASPTEFQYKLSHS